MSEPKENKELDSKVSFADLNNPDNGGDGSGEQPIWGLRGPIHKMVAGEKVEVTKKSGETQMIRVGKIVRQITFEDRVYAVAEIERKSKSKQKPAKKKPIDSEEIPVSYQPGQPLSYQLRNFIRKQVRDKGLIPKGLKIKDKKTGEKVPLTNTLIASLSVENSIAIMKACIGEVQTVRVVAELSALEDQEKADKKQAKLAELTPKENGCDPVSEAEAVESEAVEGEKLSPAEQEAAQRAIELQHEQNEKMKAEAAAIAEHEKGKPSEKGEVLEQPEEVEEMAMEAAESELEICPDTIIDKKNVGKVHANFEQLLAVIEAGLNAWLVGPAGSFKTSTAYRVADFLGIDAFALSVCAQTTKSEIMGYMNASGDYVRTPFREKYENGGIFILDEVDAGNPNVLSVLNSALSNDFCGFPDGKVAKHPDFIVIATANTIGHGANSQYSGRLVIDGATRDRFAFIDWQYDEDLERYIAFKIAKDKGLTFANKVIKMRWNAASLESKAIISPRATIDGCKMLNGRLGKNAKGRKLIEDMCIWKGLPESERVKIEKA